MKPVFEKQAWHYFLLAVLLAAVFLVSRREGFLAGEFLSINTPVWLWLTIANAVLHQVYVWFCWRTQLHFSLITRTFGASGFLYYSIGFLVLFGLRPLLIVGLAISSMNTLEADRTLLNVLALLLAVPAVYLFYSLVKYFPVRRALGIDHFNISYRGKPFIRQGIFKYTSNAMYTFGPALFWIPGLLLASTPALLATLFTHIYMWVHYYTTERPDIGRIYGRPPTQSGN